MYGHRKKKESAKFKKFPWIWGVDSMAENITQGTVSLALLVGP